MNENNHQKILSCYPLNNMKVLAGVNTPHLCKSRDFIKQALIYFDSVPSD